MMASSKYINDQRREYSLFVLHHRAIPLICDGLKSAARRVLWTARDGKKYKSATLAGATMPIHPHASPESSVNTLAAHYGNNVPLLIGYGAFGTMLDPTAYGASRYTSVKISKFCKDVLFRDIEIIPMIENYDSTLMEPEYFLPLVPLVLLNPSEGIAVGFASSILPRDLSNIINAQIRILEGKKLKDEPAPTFLPTKSVAVKNEGKWEFRGEFDRINSTTIRVTKLPYGLLHSKFDDYLTKLKDREEILDSNDGSRDYIDIEIKFKRGSLDKDDEVVLKQLNLINSVNENLNVINFDGNNVLSTNFNDLVTCFTEWRLGWYKTRYERLQRLLEEDIQKFMDIKIAIEKNVGGTVRKIKSRSELKDYLEAIKIVNIDYIADLPVYRFTEEEYKKVKDKIADSLKTLAEYKKLISSENERKTIYIKELKEIKKNYEAGTYNQDSKE